MPTSELTIDEAVAMFVHVAEQIAADADRLNEADQAIGDGDHGEGMRRGMLAARKALQDGAFTTVGEVLNTIGMRMMATMGGASGAIFGTLFRSGARTLADETAFTSHSLCVMLSEGLAGVQARGNAEVGDKTMVDALAPAANAVAEHCEAPLSVAASAAAEAAQQGVEATKDIVARKGRARTLGERTLGHPDPGALSSALILQYMADYLD